MTTSDGGAAALGAPTSERGVPDAIDDALLDRIASSLVPDLPAGATPPVEVPANGVGASPGELRSFAPAATPASAVGDLPAGASTMGALPIIGVPSLTPESLGLGLPTRLFDGSDDRRDRHVDGATPY